MAALVFDFVEVGRSGWLASRHTHSQRLHTLHDTPPPVPFNGGNLKQTGSRVPETQEHKHVEYYCYLKGPGGHIYNMC